AEAQHGYGLHHPSHKRCRPDFWDRVTLFSCVEDNSLVQTEARKENEGDRPKSDGGQFAAALWSQQSGRRDPGENAEPEDRRLTAEGGREISSVARRQACFGRLLKAA